MDKSIGVTRTQLGICVVSVVLAIPSLSTLIATSSAEGVVRQPELINFQSDHLDLKDLFGSRRELVRFQRSSGITEARSAPAQLIPWPCFLRPAGMCSLCPIVGVKGAPQGPISWIN